MTSKTLILLIDFFKEAENSKARDYEAESVDIRTTRRQPLAQRETPEGSPKLSASSETKL